MKNSANLNSTEWCNIIFENKNKEYGAFVLRQTSWKRHLLAFSLVVMAAILVSFIPFIIDSLEAKTTELKVITDGEHIISVLDKQDKLVTEEFPLTLPEPPKFIKMDKLVPPTIVEDDQVSEEDETMKSMSELIESDAVIGAYNIEEGSTDEDAVRRTTETLITSDGVGTEGATTGPVIFAEVMPEFPGGEEELNKFIQSNLRYPTIDQENGTQGRVTIRFVVDKDGKITNIEVLRGISPSCDREAVRVIKSMPRWIPGKQNGNAVPVYFNLPIMFKLK